MLPLVMVSESNQQVAVDSTVISCVETLSLSYVVSHNTSALYVVDVWLLLGHHD